MQPHFLLTLLAVAVVAGTPSCAVHDDAFDSIANIPAARPGQARVIVMCSPRRWVKGQVFLDDAEERDITGEIFVLFDTKPGPHEVRVDLGPGDAVLESGVLTAGSGETLYLAIMRKRNMEENWGDQGLETIDSLSLPDRTEVVLVPMDRGQAELFQSGTSR